MQARSRNLRASPWVKPSMRLPPLDFPKSRFSWSSGLKKTSGSAMMVSSLLLTAAGDSLTITDVDTEATTTAAKSDFKQLKPNGGVRRLIGTALVQFQLMDPDLSRRRDRCSINRTPPRSCAIGSFAGVNRWRSRCQPKSTKNSSWPTFYPLALLKIPKTALRRSTAFLRIHPSKLALC